jgi:transposase
LQAVGSVVCPFECCSMRTRTLSDEERGQIIGMRRAGMKCKDISSVLNMPCSTISTIITKWKLTGCMVTQKQVTGRGY